MIQFDLPKQKSSIIKVLGVGGGGSNAVNFMFNQNIEGVDFIICNTDSKAIEQNSLKFKKFKKNLTVNLNFLLKTNNQPNLLKFKTYFRKIMRVN